MRKFLYLGFSIGLLLFLATPMAAQAFGVEVAVGGWSQDPEGLIGYNSILSTDSLDLQDEFNFDQQTRAFGRVKLDMPLVLPNIYVLATPMRFEGNGLKTLNFSFGDVNFSTGVPFDSKVVLDQYDVALYYGIPGLETVTLGMFNVEIGLNLRVIDFSADIQQDLAGLTESVSESLALPMVYLGAQLRPLKWLEFEAEARLIAFSENHYYDYIGRVKVIPFNPLFIAAGWRHQDLEIDEADILADLEFSGPFAEVGFKF